jgi:hypothetical protein
MRVKPRDHQLNELEVLQTIIQARMARRRGHTRLFRQLRALVEQDWPGRGRECDPPG